MYEEERDYQFPAVKMLLTPAEHGGGHGCHSLRQ